MSILTRNKIQTTAVRNKHIGWSLSARHTGTQGPCDGHRQPIKWALIAHKMGTHCPYGGHRVPVLWGDFWAIYLSKRL